MIVCLVGTRAQLIKMAPVLLALDARGAAAELVLTGQHCETMDELIAEFGLRPPVARLYVGAEITGIAQMGRWFLRVLWRALVTQRALLPRSARPARDAMVVHGDTFSTLLGALIGRLRGFRVVHVEAGLTSGRLFEPFPEEITRRIVFRLAHMAFCPGPWAVGNMQRFRAVCIDTGANTLVDALRVALARVDQVSLMPPAGDFALVSLHRFENIFRQERFAFIVDALERMATRIPLALVLHPATRKQATRFGLLGRLERNPRITLYPRLTYVPFIKLLAASRFVVTDGGSNQEELSYLGKPTLIMRGATERREGLGDTAVLSNYDPAVIEDFVTRTLAAAPAARRMTTSPRPAELIAARLLEAFRTL